jgi:tRNA uridine 5-carbamoylmethylation protein Kti12
VAALDFLDSSLRDLTVEIGKLSLVMVDDNMTLHSMRRQVYATARHHKAATVIVLVTVSPAVAFQRNQLRPAAAQVDSVSWDRLHRDFEKPNEAYIAERFNVTVDSSSNDS